MARRKPKSDDKTKVASPPAAPAGEAPASSIPPSDEGRPGPESDQRLPENLEQAGARTDSDRDDIPHTDAANAAPTLPNPPELESAPLFAVCAVRIADKYFAPGARIDEEYAVRLSEKDVTELRTNNSIREG